MDKKKVFFNAALYVLIAVIGSASLLFIALGVWFLWALTSGYAFIVILAMLFGFGAGAYLVKEACCRKWALKPKLAMLAAFLPMFYFSSAYLLETVYQLTMKIQSGLPHIFTLTLGLPLAISFWGTTVLVFLSCVILGTIAKRSKGGDSENKNNSI